MAEVVDISGINRYLSRHDQGLQMRQQCLPKAKVERRMFSGEKSGKCCGCRCKHQASRHAFISRLSSSNHHHPGKFNNIKVKHNYTGDNPFQASSG